MKKTEKLLRDELYVMLMLQRSEANGAGVDCDDTDVVLACLEDLDNCPAACKADYEEDNGETSDEVVKSGDLAVTAKAAANRKVIVSGLLGLNTTVSDLDTLTFKTSEEVEISKVVLERYGYSSNTDVANVWLEDEDGNVISNKASLNTKGQANLTIKKDYRKVDGTYSVTIVLEAAAGVEAGKTIGFKVVDVNSSAKNVDLGDYSPYTYDTVVYGGAEVTFTVRGTSRDYNLEAGKSYEVAKFKAKAPSDSAILVKGFTLTNIAGTKVDLNNDADYIDANEYDYSALTNLDVEKYLDEITVKVGGKEVKASANINKDDELVISFDKSVEIAAKENMEFVVEASFSADFDAYGDSIIYAMVQGAHFNAIDSKTEARVSVPDDVVIAGYSWPTYTFNGGKVKLTNIKLGNIDAALDSTDVAIAEGNINVTETIKGDLSVTVNGTTVDAITAMRLQIAGDEYEGNDNAVAGTYVFKNVEIEEGGKVKILVDITDKTNIPMPAGTAIEGQSFTFTVAGWDNFYYTEGKTTDKVDIAGSISPSKLTIQAAKASLTNNLSKVVEYKNNESSRKVVFDGVYTAKKGDIELNEFTLTAQLVGIATALNQAADTTTVGHNNKVTFYLLIDGEEVADGKLALNAAGTDYVASSTFSNTTIEAGKTANIVVEAEVDAKNTNATDDDPEFSSVSLGKFKLELEGEDENGNTAGYADRNTVELKVVETGTPSISSASSKNTVLKKASDAKIAEFVVKPANGASEMDLDSIKFNLYINGSTTPEATPANHEVTLSIDDANEDRVTSATSPYYTYEPFKNIDSDGVTIKVTLDDEFAGVVELKDLTINGKEFTSRTFKKSFEDAIVQVVSIKDMKGSTEMTLDVDKESDATVANLTLTLDKSSTGAVVDTDMNFFAAGFEDEDTVTIDGIVDAVRNLKKISYEVTVSDAADMPSYCTNGTTCTATYKCVTPNAKCYKVTISKGDYDDFFKLSDGTYARVLKSNTD